MSAAPASTVARVATVAPAVTRNLRGANTAPAAIGVRVATGERRPSPERRGLPTQQSQTGVAEQGEPARFYEEQGQDDDYLSPALAHVEPGLPKVLQSSDHILPVLRGPYMSCTQSRLEWGGAVLARRIPRS